MSINKQEVFYRCVEEVDKRIEKYQRELDLIQQTRDSSEPSTDPDERGGAGEMLGDTESVARQLNEATQMKEDLANLNIRTTSDFVKPGNIVETAKHLFFVSVPLGEVELDDGRKVYALSTDAPVYQYLDRKEVGDSFKFNDKEFVIKDIH